MENAAGPKNKVLVDELCSIYGERPELVEEKIQTLTSLVRHFEDVFGGGKVGIIRVPGRLNTLGMHADHRGAFVNPIAIQKETLLCCQPLDTDTIEIHNLDPHYGVRSFNIGEEKPTDTITSSDQWLYETQQLTDERIRLGTNNDWVNKVKAAPVYLQRMVFPECQLKGFRGVLVGNIPPRAGLSSSSALMIAVFEALLDMNNLEIDYNDYAIHCGIAEWFVGTRGGCGDHAAILYSRQGMITHMKTTPEFVLGDYIPFPKGYSIVVFNSGIEADKTGHAVEKFNEKTATYEIGEMYLRKYMRLFHPKLFQQILDHREHLDLHVKKFHLQDIVEHLEQKDIYRLLLKVPLMINRNQLLHELPDEQKNLKAQFATHPKPDGGYPVRAVITYGLSEAARTMQLSDILKQGDIERYGCYMNISHDGDRVAGLSPKQQRLKQNFDPELELYQQLGDYNCSIPQIDEMVDLAQADGAIGAQIAGAGLGGSVMVLVANEKTPHLIDVFERNYYAPNRIEPRYLRVIPIDGASQL